MGFLCLVCCLLAELSTNFRLTLPEMQGSMPLPQGGLAIMEILFSFGATVVSTGEGAAPPPVHSRPHTAGGQVGLASLGGKAPADVCRASGWHGS